MGHEEFMSQEEVDALLKGVTGDQDEASASEDEPRASARTTWRRRNASSAAACRRSRSSTSVSRGCSASACSTSCAAAPKSRSARCACSKYSEFIRNLVVPTNLNLVHMKPLRGTALIVFDPNLVFLVVDNLFGGDGRFHTRVEGRDFTQTEQRIIQRMLDIVFETYAKSWEPVYPLEFEYMRSEMNTQFANIATPNEVVVVDHLHDRARRRSAARSTSACPTR